MLELGRFQKYPFQHLTLSPVSARGSGDPLRRFYKPPSRRWRFAALGEQAGGIAGRPGASIR
jgi:hypothetical protein